MTRRAGLPEGFEQRVEVVGVVDGAAVPGGGPEAERGIEDGSV